MAITELKCGDLVQISDHCAQTSNTHPLRHSIHIYFSDADKSEERLQPNSVHIQGISNDNIHWSSPTKQASDTDFLRWTEGWRHPK